METDVDRRSRPRSRRCARKRRRSRTRRARSPLVDEPTFTAAGAILVRIKALRTTVEALFAPHITRAFDAHRACSTIAGGWTRRSPRRKRS